MKAVPIRILVLALVLAGPAHASGVIQGTIWPTRAEARRAERARELAPPEEPKRGFFARLFAPMLQPGHEAAAASNTPRPPRMVPKPQPDVVDAVVSVRQIPDNVERRLDDQSRRGRQHANHRVVLSRSRYRPRVLAVPTGSDIEFQNLDRIWHSTFSVSVARRFDLGKMRPGVLDTVRFGRPGVINLHCDIHPEETGFVVVTPNHAFARPDSLGRFMLPKLPPGTYVLDLWHPTRGGREQVVVVPRHGDAYCDVAF